MIDEKTIESAKRWCRTGVQWVEKNAVNSGLGYLDQAIAAFEEAGDLSWLTYARHQRLQALKLRSSSDDLEVLGEDVLRGYAKLDDSYGKALTLSHLAESMAEQGRWENAMARLNLAAAAAESAGHEGLLAYILMQRGELHLEHRGDLQAVRLFRRAETVFQGQGLDDDAARSRLAAAEALVKLGERPEAIALLEDVQNHFFTRSQYREALGPLSLLVRLYDRAEMLEDKNRVSELVHYCGQYILQGAPDVTPRSKPRMPRPAEAP